MAEHSAACSVSFFAEKWKSWCRLCAKDATQYVNVIYSTRPGPINATDPKCDIDLAHAILEFLQIHIKEDDKLPQAICAECHGVVLSLIKFKDRANKVQKMYNDLKNMHEKSATKLQLLLENYGIYKGENLIPQKDIELPVEKIFVAGLEDTTHTPPSRSASCTQNEDFSVEQHLEIIQKDEKTSDFDDPIGDEDRDSYHDSYLPSAESDGSSSDTEDSIIRTKKPKRKAKAKQQNSSTTESKFSAESSVSCKLCSQSFQGRKYSIHMKKVHGVFACAQCPSSFKTQLLLNRHMKEHKRLYNCLHCEQTFERKGLASQHMKMEHKNKTSFVCESCGEALGTQKKLQMHMLTHTGSIPFECQECGKSFGYKASWRRHMQTHGDKFICPQCGIQLSCRAALIRHKIVHSDTFKHKCDYCGRAFKRAKALKDHILAHTGLRPYSCDFCEKTFSTGSSCRFHKKTMHPVELAEWEASGARAYTKNVPNLNELREIARAGKNLQPLMSKQEGYINPQHTKEVQHNEEDFKAVASANNL